MGWNCMSKELRFLQITAKHQDFFNHISNDKNFIPKYPDNALTDSVLTQSRTWRQLFEEKAPVNDFVGISCQCGEILLQVKWAMASFRYYDVIKTLLMTNFHLNLIKLWWQFFQMFVYCDVVMLEIGRYWPWKTITVSSHVHMPVPPMLLHRMALVSFGYCFIKIWASCDNFFGKWFTAPLAKNCPYAHDAYIF